MSEMLTGLIILSTLGIVLLAWVDKLTGEFYD
jgi:hypothetical protein